MVYRIEPHKHATRVLNSESVARLFPAPQAQLTVQSLLPECDLCD